ncbi:MAG: PRD domain-containing protein [Faecalibacterium sp.]
MSEKSTLPTLSANGRKLILRLTQMPRAWTTTTALAEAVGISRRTVMRELPGVEDFLQAAGFSFQRSPGQGVRLDEPLERRDALISLLDERSAPVFSLPREERRQRLLAQLFAAQEPVKTYALAYDLAISENTLSADLDRLEEWLASHGLRLNRRPGVGVWISGTPEQRRRAVGTLLRSWLPLQDWDAFLSGAAIEMLPLSELLDHSTARTVWRALEQFEQEEELHFTDAGFLSLALHLTLTIQQLREGVQDSVELVPPLDLSMATRLARRIENALGLNLPRSEISYLALYLDACRTRPNTDGPDAREMNTRYLAACLIDTMARQMGVDLRRYPSLADDLYCHLRPMLHRLSQGIQTENPQLALIQEHYPRLWRATRFACDDARARLNLPAIPDAEAGYLAMHFGAVLEQDAAARMQVNAVVVCPYGMASSRFLASQIEREFTAFHIQKVGALRDLNADELRAQGIDLVISTVPLELPFPSVTVDPILNDQNRTVLRAAAQQYSHKGERRTPRPAQAPENRAQALRYAARLSAALLELLDALVIRKAELPGSRTALIREAARLFCSQPEAAHRIEKALFQREGMGETFIPPLNAVLLHCFTPEVPGCRFGYIKAEPPVYENGRAIHGALVLLAPDSEDGIPADVMQAVSAILIEQPELMEQLRLGHRDQAAALLEKGLGERFRQALTMRIGKR